MNSKPLMDGNMATMMLMASKEMAEIVKTITICSDEYYQYKVISKSIDGFELIRIEYLEREDVSDVFTIKEYMTCSKDDAQSVADAIYELVKK